MLHKSGALRAHLLVAVVTLATGASLSARAQSSDRVRVESKTSSIRLDLLSETTYMKIGSSNFMAAGVRFGFGYGLSRRLGVSLGIGQTMMFQGGIKAFYLGLGASVQYAILGSFVEQTRTIFKDGDPWIVTGASKRGRSLYVAAGVDQFYLNGSQSIYPASGATAGIWYEQYFWRWKWVAGIRSGYLAATGKTVIPMIFNLGVNFRF